MEPAFPPGGRREGTERRGPGEQPGAAHDSLRRLLDADEQGEAEEREKSDDAAARDGIGPEVEGAVCPEVGQPAFAIGPALIRASTKRR